jgi:hypothetical protein
MAGARGGGGHAVDRRVAEREAQRRPGECLPRPLQGVQLLDAPQVEVIVANGYSAHGAAVANHSLKVHLT